MDDCSEARISFVVAGGDPPELFDLGEEVLDEMAPLVHLDVAGNAGGAVGLGRDHGLSAALVQVRADVIAAVRSTIVDVPTVRRHKLSQTSVTAQSYVIVQIRLANGAEGHCQVHP